MSCSVHDAATLEKQGVPTATLCTTGFLNAGAMQANMMGVPNLPIIGIPFPFATLPPEQARRRGAEVLDQIIAALTTSEV